VSDGEYVQRCRLRLVEQVDQLAGLRNANPRDPGFKLWRQNTLTVLQRIWPDDATRVERFRRIVFSPAQSRNGPEAVRANFARGGSEANAFLRALIDVIDREGVPDPADAAERDVGESGIHEDDFPVLELPSGGEDAPAAAPHDDGENIIDLGGSRPAAGEPEGEAGARSAGTPAPAQLYVQVRASSPSASAPRVRPPAPPAAAAPPASRPRTTRSARRPKPAPKQRLKDMLGLGAIEAAANEALAAEASPAPRPAAVPAPAAPAASPPAASAPAAPLPPAPTASETVVAPASPAPTPAAEPKAVVRPEQGIVTSQPRPLHGKPQHVQSLASLFSPELPTELPSPPAAAPAPAAPAPATTIDPEAFARATQDFLLNSPVLGLQGRPVQRQSDGTEYLDPDAVAVATLAADIGRLGVPDGARASARAQLHELAQQIERGELDWSLLRGGVTFAMDHPELARRLLPILLPWLERAA
jgi:hypothetical protein